MQKEHLMYQQQQLLLLQQQVRVLQSMENRSVSSKSGSADLLEAAGVNLQLNAEQVAKCIEEIGIGFLFAPAHHSAMKHAIGPRKELGTTHYV